jgi:hypothetical protein
MSDSFSRVEVITGIARRRRFSTDQKLAVVAETMQPGMSICDGACHPTLGFGGTQPRGLLMPRVKISFSGDERWSLNYFRL